MFFDNQCRRVRIGYQLAIGAHLTGGHPRLQIGAGGPASLHPLHSQTGEAPVFQFLTDEYGRGVTRRNSSMSVRVVYTTFRGILKNTRRGGILALPEREIEERDFAGWSMGWDRGEGRRKGQ